MSVTENLNKIIRSIPSTVTLVAVSKTKPNALIMEAYDAGQRDFGENYVQELVDKEAQMPKDIRWHFIGHLQSNKAKYIVPFVHLIHGVDSFKLLKEINKQALKNKVTVNCLLQLHIALEETKFGFDFGECERMLHSNELKELRNINLMGFMGMASNTGDRQQVEKEFRALAEFGRKQQATFPALKTLSFGMSNDYKLAMECGSTMIRVGSSIFGEREYSR